MSAHAVEIPHLKKKKKEKEEEGGAAGIPLGLGHGGGLINQLAGVGMRGGFLAGRSLLFTISEFMSTGAGIVTILGTVGALSMLSRWDVNRQREIAMADDSMRAFLEESADAKASLHRAKNESLNMPSLPGGSESLNYLARANGGALADGDDGGGSGDASAGTAAFDGSVNNGVNANSTSGGGVSYGTNLHANFGKTYGDLTSAAGQAQWNGVGMSGGVLKGFDKPKMKLQAAPTAVSLGSASGVKNSGPSFAGGRTFGTTSKRVSGAMSQLRATSNLSRQGASAGSAEIGHNFASSAFEGSSAIGSAGGPIGGSGAGSASEAAGLDGGNAVNFSNSSQPIQAAPVNGSQNDTPWQQDVNNAISLMAIGAVLILIASMLNKLMLLPFRIMAMICAGIAAACGTAAASIGISLMAHWHQTLQGTIFTAGGGIIAAAAAIVLAGGFKDGIKGDLTGSATGLTSQMMPPGAGVAGGPPTIA